MLRPGRGLVPFTDLGNFPIRILKPLSYSMVNGTAFPGIKEAGA
jgi:hypothetical protein